MGLCGVGNRICSRLFCLIRSRKKEENILSLLIYSLDSCYFTPCIQRRGLAAQFVDYVKLHPVPPLCVYSSFCETLPTPRYKKNIPLEKKDENLSSSTYLKKKKERDEMSALVVMVISSWNKKTRPACEIVCVVWCRAKNVVPISPTDDFMVVTFKIFFFWLSFKRERERKKRTFFFCFVCTFFFACRLLFYRRRPFSVEDTHTHSSHLMCVVYFLKLF